MPRKPGSHLTYEERCQISSYSQNSYSLREISSRIGRDPSVICREIRRNSVSGEYISEQAHENASLRRSVASSYPRKIKERVLQEIKSLLEESDPSPEQISGRLKSEFKIKLSFSAIYNYIWKDMHFAGELYKHLRRRAKRPRKPRSKTAGRSSIPNRVGIEKRPDIVESKSRFGDLELDTIVGAAHKGAIVSVVDRASKYTWLRLVARATAQNINQAIESMLEHLSYQKLIQTYTSDNGTEFSAHEKLVKSLGGSFYFATPYHSWERGLNEHTNGLVRQYFPKGTEFTSLSEEQVSLVEAKLNNRPRKVLGYQTPLEYAQALVAESGADFLAIA